MLAFPAPSAAVLAHVTAKAKIEFIKAWRAEAALTVGELTVQPTLKACSRYYDALVAGFPAMPLALTRDSEGPSYSYKFTDGRTDPLLAYWTAKDLGLA